MGETLDRVSRQRPFYPAPSVDIGPFPNEKLVWLDTAPTVISSAALQAWLTVDITDDVPEGATAVLLQLDWIKNSSLGFTVVDFRKRANTQTYKALALSPSSRGTVQISVPILSTKLRRSFDYELITTAITTTFEVKVLAYLK